MWWITAWMYKFIKNCRANRDEGMKCPNLTVQELQRTQGFWYCISQESAVLNEITNLKLRERKTVNYEQTPAYPFAFRPTNSPTRWGPNPTSWSALQEAPSYHLTWRPWSYKIDDQVSTQVIAACWINLWPLTTPSLVPTSHSPLLQWTVLASWPLLYRRLATASWILWKSYLGNLTRDVT